MSYNDLHSVKIEIPRRAARHGSERTGPGICMSFFAGVYSCSLIAQPNLIPPNTGILHIYIEIHTNTGLDGFQNWTQIWRPHELRNELLRRAYRNQHPDTRFVNSECACWKPLGRLLDVSDRCFLVFSLAGFARICQVVVFITV